MIRNKITDKKIVVKIANANAGRNTLIGGYTTGRNPPTLIKREPIKKPKPRRR